MGTLFWGSQLSLEVIKILLIIVFHTFFIQYDYSENPIETWRKDNVIKSAEIISVYLLQLW